MCVLSFLLLLSYLGDRHTAVEGVETRFVVLSTGGTGSSWFVDLMRMHEHICLTKPSTKKTADVKRLDDMMNWLAQRKQKREGTGSAAENTDNDRLHVAEPRSGSQDDITEQYSLSRLFSASGRCRYFDAPNWSPMPRYPYEARGMLLNVLKDCPLVELSVKTDICQSDEIMAEIKKHSEVHVILLKRKNLLNQAVQLIDQSSRWRLTKTGAVDSRSIDLDDIQVIDTMGRIRRVEAQWSNFLSDNDVNTLEIYYEDLLEKPMDQMRRIARFLDLSPFSENPVPLVAKLERSPSRSDLTNEQRFSNWKKVARIVSRIPEYRDFVDSKLRTPLPQVE